MKKTTINNILMAVIALLSVSICFLIFCIVSRPRYVTSVSEPETAVITEAPSVSEAPLSQTDNPAQTEDTDTSDTLAVSSDMHGKTSTKVNIRDAASADARVVDTVEKDTTFDIIEVQDDGWTKILYNNTEAYISSDYVIIVND
jgi:uncharacterized protein YgiM (DUF1202 family)